MIFENIDIHGAAELEELTGGAKGTLRVPLCVHDCLEKGKDQNRNSTGIEYRFVLSGDSAKFEFALAEGERSKITVMYGDFVADWPETTKLVSGNCTVEIVQSKRIELLRKIAKEYAHRFSPDVVRLLFEGVRPKLLSVIGDVSVPALDMYPEKRYLAYGSSITHGSISLHPYYCYPERVASNLGADVINYGFAGSARLEPQMADYIANECEFDFATLEMGINILSMDPQEYEDRVRYFVSRIAKAHPNSKIFAIDVFYCQSDIVCDGRAERFRQILEQTVRELGLTNVVYVNGKTVLKDPSKLSEGLIHPNPDGILEIARNLTDIIKSNLD